MTNRHALKASTNSSYDVAIVGGGVIGCSIACFLDDARVCVIERDPAYARASSALSASSIRQQFSTPLSVAMSQFGFGFLHNASDHLGVDDQPVDIGLTERGYLILADSGGASELRNNHAMQLNHGANVEMLDNSALSSRFSWLNSEGIALAGLGIEGEGWFDGYALLQAFRNRARANGVDFKASEVVAFTRSGARVERAITGDGEHISAGVFVNACGPWAAELCGLLALELPVSPRKRQVFVFDCRDPLPELPMIFDPSGFWCRPDGGRYLTGKAPAAADDQPGAPLDEIDYQMFEEIIWPLLARRIPAFQRIKLTGAWAGYYALNTFDQNAILGWHPQLNNLILANGFSGHGMQHAPAVGRGIAELIDFGEYRSLDLSPLSLLRVQQNRPIAETTVY